MSISVMFWKGTLSTLCVGAVLSYSKTDSINVTRKSYPLWTDMTTTFSWLQKRKCRTKTDLFAVRSQIYSHLCLTTLRLTDTDSWHWSDPVMTFSRSSPPLSLIVSPLSRYLCYCSPQIVGPPLAGGVEVHLILLLALALVNSIWCRIILLGVEPGPETSLWRGDACHAGISWRKGTQILLLLLGLGCYSVSCQDNFFALRYKVAIATSVSLSVYELS